MATIDSDKVDRALRGKMKAERKGGGDWCYVIRDDEGIVISMTGLSRGAKHTLSSSRISVMSRQLRLCDSQLFVNLVSCTLSREDALNIMKNNPPFYNSRR